MSYLESASAAAAHAAWEAAREILEKYGFRPPEDLDEEMEAALATTIEGYIG